MAANSRGRLANCQPATRAAPQRNFAQRRQHRAALPDMFAWQIAEGVRSGAWSAQDVSLAHMQRLRDCDGELRSFAAINASAVQQAAELGAVLQVSSQLAGSCTLLAGARGCARCAQHGQGRKLVTAGCAADERLRALRRRGAPLPVLAGVPIAIKDAFATCGMPAACGVPAGAGPRLDGDAASVRLLRAAGAIVLGKTHLTELCSGAAPPTINPHGAARTPGGSSSGSAAAVAACVAPLATGSQTLGSVVRPAAFCGVCGLRPTFGAVARGVLMCVSPALDHVGFLARCVHDLRLALLVHVSVTSADRSGSAETLNRMAQPPPLTLSDGCRADMHSCGRCHSESAPLRALLPPPQRAAVPYVLIVPRCKAWERASSEAVHALERVAQRLANAGAIVRTVQLPASFDNYHQHAQVCHAGSHCVNLLCARSARFGAGLFGRLHAAELCGSHTRVRIAVSAEQATSGPCAGADDTWSLAPSGLAPRRCSGYLVATASMPFPRW